MPQPTRKHPAVLAFLLVTLSAFARDKAANWVEVRSAHFDVITNADEKTGRKIADQFERMRNVFHAAFPHLDIEKRASITVLAIKGEKEFRALEPEAYLAKGQLKLGGLFLSAPEKNFILARVDAEGEHPYAVVYHEYTHFLMNASDSMPLWLNEGLAEFYENTDIHEKDVALGQPSLGDIELLRENRLLPLPTLFAVDANSPYYHEENKGSIFYAESWALTHYLLVKDFNDKTQHLPAYLELLSKNTDLTTAATTAFGDLKQLQSNLDAYIHKGTFSFFKLATVTNVDDTTFKIQNLTDAKAGAIRSDFLAYSGRSADARTLLDHLLQENPKEALAHETMGYLEFRAGNLDSARKWYDEAVDLDSQSYIAHYYYAMIAMGPGGDVTSDPKIESNLRAAIKLNPSFAPAFDRLAVCEAMQHKDLEEAHMMSLTAVQLDPANIAFRINAANVLMQMQREQDAVRVLQNSLRIAKTPQETGQVQQALLRVQAYMETKKAAMQQQAVQTSVTTQSKSTQFESEPAADVRITSSEEVPKGTHRFLTGTLQNVKCNSAQLDLVIAAKGKTLPLHAGNYFKIQFSALGFRPEGEINPCKDLENRPAKVEYIEPAAASASSYLIGIELHK